VTFLLIGASPPGSRAMRELGFDFDVVVAPGEDPARLSTPARKVFVRDFLPDPLSVLNLSRPDEYRGVVSFTEDGLLAHAIAASVLGLPGPSPAAVAATRCKSLMRQRLTAAGIPQPFFGILGEDPVPQNRRVIVKPVDGAGSVGVTLLEPGAEPAPFEPGRLIWEEYVEGQEYSVETVSTDVDHRVLAITEKTTTGPPAFVEREHVVPAPVTDERRAELASYTRRCLTALGVNNCAAHTEVRWGSSGPVIIETHTRPGGDRIPLLVELVTGIDQYREAILASTRDRPPIDAHPGTAERHASARSVFFTPGDADPDTLRGATWWTDYPQIVITDLKGLDRREDNEGGSSGRLGNVVVAHHDEAELQALVAEIRRRAALPTIPSEQRAGGATLG
jgi:hypothetical protein